MQVSRVMKAICYRLGNEIHWPTQAQGRQVTLDFLTKHRVRNCYGAMDGTDIRIRTPRQAVAQAYYNKDGFHSIKLHAVVDSLFAASTSHKLPLIINS